ncbi:hypothetical protein HNW13_018680 [Shewanella sp. BF02_Schw]|uniref:hypothetical protein n=1 Tax=Shewanella sp. BF02_Schw TaxID=394908 RepID=UPI0017812C26|nr:hypothetical protein [Shewanella sp. BF02_Schw]MBO1897768.1 hypothetical protein [Shewanella sp. BF02_Schw]
MQTNTCANVEQKYYDRVHNLITLFDSHAEVPPEYTDRALEDGLSVFDAVNDWFSDEVIKFELSHHLSDVNSRLVDIDVTGIGTIRRIVISMDIKQGDLFNVYYSESSKGGALFNTDIMTTLLSFDDQC